MSRRTITLMGANSQQARSIIKHLASLGPTFSQTHTVRAAVRDASKYHNGYPDLITSVVQADMSDPASLEPAMEGTDVLYLMTIPDPVKGRSFEEDCGKNVLTAFIEAIEKRTSSQPADTASAHRPTIIFSSFVDVEALTGGRIEMVNGSAKAAIGRHIQTLCKEAHGAFDWVLVYPGMFMQNFQTTAAPTVNSDGPSTFTMCYRPDVKVPLVDIDDLGPLVGDIITVPATYSNKHVLLYGEAVTADEMIHRFEHATGRRATLNRMPVKEYFDGALPPDKLPELNKMLSDMYHFINQVGYYGNLPWSRAGDDVLLQQPTRKTTLEEWFARNMNLDPTSNTKPTSPAEHALYDWFMSFLPPQSSRLDFDQDVAPRFRSNAVVEFPYVPGATKGKLPERLEGLDAIKGYFGNWKDMFRFTEHEWTSLDTLEGSGGKRAVARIRLKGVLLPKEVEYIQDYTSFVEVDDAGLITKYVEHWAADRFTMDL